MPRKTIRLKVTTVYIRPDQDTGIRKMSKKTRVPMAEIVRQGIDLALQRHGMR